jgi:hypothetical protein
MATMAEKLKITVIATYISAVALVTQTTIRSAGAEFFVRTEVAKLIVIFLFVLRR